MVDINRSSRTYKLGLEAGRFAARVLTGAVGFNAVADLIELVAKKEAGNVDIRLAKIEAARDNLLEALNAIDEIKATAQEHKRELQTIQQSVVKIVEERDDLIADKALLEQMTSAERDRLRKMLGVPTRLQSILIWITTFVFGGIVSWLLTYAYDSKVKAWFDALSTQAGW